MRSARPIDGGPPLAEGDPDDAALAIQPSALARQRVGTSFLTGVKVIDIFTPICFGQRLGIFAGSGVGKSTLLAMLASAEAFDTVVVALVGERGREVREFLEDTIGPACMAKTVAVVVDQRRKRHDAQARARHGDARRRAFPRSKGDRVLLVLDSITRFAHALREVATGTGEPPVARGYPASVFTDLPKLLERAGPGAEGAGSITAIISVLIDGDDHNDPVADSVRGILDGHVVLDRTIAEQGRYPPVNPLSSISRLAAKAWSDDQRKLVTRLKAMISRFEDTRDIRLLGAYQAGADARTRCCRQAGAADLRGDDPVAERPPLARSVRRSRAPSEEQGQAECGSAGLTGTSRNWSSRTARRSQGRGRGAPWASCPVSAAEAGARALHR